MDTLTIPKKLTKGEELVVIPRRDYEEFLSLKKINSFQEVELTPVQKKRLEKARKNLKQGKALSLPSVDLTKEFEVWDALSDETLISMKA
ncbi:MAG: hypothetical protein AAB642_00480 [Patescibacteria group bacterium]